MKTSLNKPIMLYDGDCGFCQRWIEKWRKITGETIFYTPYQQALKDYPQLTEEQCKNAVRLVLPDGAVHSGAHAVFTALALAKKYSRLLWLYDHLPLFASVSEIGYQFIAKHRLSLSRIYRSAKKCQ